MTEKQSNRGRTQRADAVVNPVKTESEAAWRAALQYADEAALKIEGQWGIGRLEKLVAPDLAAKFAMAQWQLDEAIHAGDAQLAAQKSAAIARGWHALDKAAREAGHTPEDIGQVWFHRSDDGKKAYAFAVDIHAADRLRKKYPDHTVYSFAEVARIIEASQAGVFTAAAKQVFPGATVVVQRSREEPEDDLPF